MYAELVADEETKDFRFRLPESLKNEWLAMCEARRIGIQDGLIGLMQTVLEQDELVQAMLLRQIPASPDLVQFVLHRLSSGASAKKHGTAKGHGVKMLKAASKSRDLAE